MGDRPATGNNFFGRCIMYQVDTRAWTVSRRRNGHTIKLADGKSQHALDMARTIMNDLGLISGDTAKFNLAFYLIHRVDLALIPTRYSRTVEITEDEIRGAIR